MAEGAEGATWFGMPIGDFFKVGGIWLLAGTIVAGLIKLWPDMRRIRVDGEEKLRNDLEQQIERSNARIERLETTIENMRKHYEEKLEAKEIEHTNTIAIMRHKLNNLDMCLQSLLLLIEANPDDPEKVREAARKAREIRAEQMQRETMETSNSRRPTPPPPPTGA